MPHNIDVIIEDDRWIAFDLSELALNAINATLAFQNIDIAEISLLGCDDRSIAVLNADFRGKSVPTNVLSWPNDDLKPFKNGDVPLQPKSDHTGIFTLGDIALAYETCSREASEQNKKMTEHVTHLIVHGTLHLLGFDHIRDLDATRMEALEVNILGSMGLSDPY